MILLCCICSLSACGVTFAVCVCVGMFTFPTGLTGSLSSKWSKGVSKVSCRIFPLKEEGHAANNGAKLLDFGRAEG